MIPRKPKDQRGAELRSLCSSGKRRFRTEDAALKALDVANAHRNEGDVARRERRAYECEGPRSCGGWHLTSWELPPAPPRTALPVQSARRIKEQRQRSKMLTEVFGVDPLCARCGKPADDAHEVLSRARGGSITDPDNIVPLCRGCHGFITTHPAQAAVEGWSRSA